MKDLATEVIAAIGKPRLSGSVELHFKDGRPKNVKTIDSINLENDDQQQHP